MHTIWRRYILLYVFAILCIKGLLVALPETSTVWSCYDGSQIEVEWRCDDLTDCRDGSDEFPENCAHKDCADNQFRCNNSRCIDESFHCDGEPDCMLGDRSDEDNCEIQNDDEDCLNPQFKCKTGNTCLPPVWVCDFERDCMGGSDEWNCPCIDDTYGCYVGGESICLKNATKCDGIRHCDDGEDEQKCESTSSNRDGDFSCPPTRYKCRGGRQYISWKFVCDGLNDCKDDSDEGGLCHVNGCGLEKITEVTKKVKSKLACEHCHESPDGPQCYCDAGFRLDDDGTHCIDEDECEDMQSDKIHNNKKLAKLYAIGLSSVCHQNCENTAGGFHCSCVDGYQLDTDGFTCKALGTYSPALYIGIDNEIRVFSLRDPGDKSLYYYSFYKSEDLNETILGMDIVLAATPVFFWIEKNSAKLLMKHDEIITRLSIGSADFVPVAVSVDWVTRNIFVTVSKSGSYHYSAIVILTLPDKIVENYDENGDNAVTTSAVEILVDELINPTAVALYPSKGIFVVADKGDIYSNDRRILVVNMDGSNIRVLVKDVMLVPHDVIIDYVQNAVIWASSDESNAFVEMIRLDGTQRGVLMSREVNRFPLDPVSIAFFEDSLFISDRLSREVRSWRISEISLYGDQNVMYGSEGVVKLEDKKRLGAIKIAHPVLQRPLKDGNLCKSSGCSHACVMIPMTLLQTKELLQTVRLAAKCICPRTHQISNDGKSCLDRTSLLHHPRTFSPPPDKKTKSSISPPEEVFIQSSLPNTDQPTKAACHNPGRFRNAKLVPNSKQPYFSVKDQISILCAEGYSLKMGRSRKSKMQITCLSTGKWSEPPSKCVLTRKILLSTGKLSPNNMTPRPNLSHALCVSLNCGPWGRCVKNNADEYECQCPHGESTSMVRCLSPNRNNMSSIEDSTGVPPFGQPAHSSKSPGLMASLVVVVVLLFLILIFFSWKCMKKKSYSVNLRYLRSRSNKVCRVPLNNRDSVLLESSSIEKCTSIDNPNYSSPSKRRRLPKPSLRDDGSDSGIQQSFGSESTSSTTSDNSACDRILKMNTTEDSDEPATSSTLLHNVIVEEDELSMGDVSVGSESFSRFEKTGLGGRLGDLFKMRKTQSRECMLPKRKLSKSKRMSTG